VAISARIVALVFAALMLAVAGMMLVLVAAAAG
jgi:hypothetical protein